MKRSHCVMVRACSYLKAHTRALTLGVALVCIASLASPAWSQWTGGPTGPVYYNGGSVGIGTTNPVSRVDINSGNLRLSRYGDNYGYVFHNYGGGTTLNIGYMTTDDTTWLGGGPIMTMLYTGNVGIGTTNPQYLLSVNGTMGAQDVIVTNTGWSDYVFRPGYRLRPLSEVNAYIQANHHLPDIPSEAEVKEKGVSVGQMQSKLLAKVEELTLHMIQQEKENKELRGRIAQLESRAAGSGAPAAGR